MACFTVDGDHHGGKIVTVGIDWKTGIAAKDWDSVARKEKIEASSCSFHLLIFDYLSVTLNFIVILLYNHVL